MQIRTTGIREPSGHCYCGATYCQPIICRTIYTSICRVFHLKFIVITLLSEGFVGGGREAKGLSLWMK